MGLAAGIAVAMHDRHIETIDFVLDRLTQTASFHRRVTSMLSRFAPIAVVTGV